MFCSDDAGRYWLSRTGGRAAPELFPELLGAYRDLATLATGARSLISLGPGDGSADVELLRVLSGPDRPLEYVGMDINRVLLEHVLARTRTVARSTGIRMDFEGNGGTEWIRAAPGPRLVSLLGNTLGNLDVDEYDFVAKVTGALDRGDCFLVSLACGRFSEQDIADRMNGLSGLRTLLANGLLSSGVVATLDEGEKEVQDAARVEAGTSDIPGCSALKVVHVPSGRRLLNVRRYDPASFSAWMASTFGLLLVDARCVPVPDTTIAVGAWLFRRCGTRCFDGSGWRRRR